MSEPVQTFAELGVEADLCDALRDRGITTAFPIQALTLPLALSGADIIGQARTGTGKTYGFGLPILQRIDVDQGLQALVIVPTRELCLQVADDLTLAGKRKGVKVVATYGGASMDEQADKLAAGAHLVVGTPGRLLDLSRRKLLDLSSCRALVLDEADEMLDLGFLPDVEELISQVADDRQTLLFSATMPAAIIALGRRYMTNPTFMQAESPDDDTTPDKVEQFFFLTHRMNKPALCARILSAPDVDKAVVFCSTKRMADKLASELANEGLNVRAIHSGLTQDKRERTLKAFRTGKLRILCATEVAARGLDIDDVTHVINFDTPDDEHMYLHRIGRTGRAGHDGVAVTLVLHNELPRMQMILRELGIEAEIPEMFSTSPELVELFDLGPVAQTRKRTNAYGTVNLDRDQVRAGRKVRKTIRKGDEGDAEVASQPRRRSRVKQVHHEEGADGSLDATIAKINEELAPVHAPAKVTSRSRLRNRRRHLETDVTTPLTPTSGSTARDVPMAGDTNESSSRMTRRPRVGVKNKDSASTFTLATGHVTFDGAEPGGGNPQAGVMTSRRRERRRIRTLTHEVSSTTTQETRTQVAGTKEISRGEETGIRPRSRRSQQHLEPVPRQEPSVEDTDNRRPNRRAKGRLRGGANRAGAARLKGRISAQEARGQGKPLLRRPMRIEFLP